MSLVFAFSDNQKNGNTGSDRMHKLRDKMKKKKNLKTQ